MLIVTIDLIHGVYTPSQKRNLIHRVTEAAVEVEGESLRDQILVKMNEIGADGWAIGGQPLAPATIGSTSGASTSGASTPGAPALSDEQTKEMIEDRVGQAEEKSALRRLNRMLGRNT